jgi:hypothetical protein
VTKKVVGVFVRFSCAASILDISTLPSGIPTHYHMNFRPLELAGTKVLVVDHASDQKK